MSNICKTVTLRTRKIKGGDLSVDFPLRAVELNLPVNRGAA